MIARIGCAVIEDLKGYGVFDSALPADQAHVTLLNKNISRRHHLLRTLLSAIGSKFGVPPPSNFSIVIIYIALSPLCCQPLVVE
jgi:hypothetical protein